MQSQTATNDKQLTLEALRESVLSPVKDIGLQFRSFVIENLSIDRNCNLKLWENSGLRWITVTDSNNYKTKIRINNNVWKRAIEQGYEISNDVSIDVTIDSLSLDKWCQLEIVAMAVRVSGQSQMEAIRESINKHCIKKGYFQRTKRPLPVIVRKVAIVTSKQSNIESDITNQIGIKKTFIDSYRFNGKADDLCLLIHKLANMNQHDLICLYRGGREDEYMFVYSDTVVLDEIVKSPIPIVSALGHEQDIPPVQGVVDMGFASPSKFALYIKELNNSALGWTEYFAEDINKYFKKYLLNLENSILKNLSDINNDASSMKENYEKKKYSRNITIIALISIILLSLIIAYFKINAK